MVAGEYDGRLWMVTTTFPSRDEALAVARRLAGEGLAACAQVGAQLASVYVWGGALVEETETALALKVADAQLEPCLARLAELHPYEVPQLLAFRAGRVAAPYGRWVCGEEPV